MDTSQLQRNKLDIINWVTEIQDSSIVEKNNYNYEFRE